MCERYRSYTCNCGWRWALDTTALSLPSGEKPHGRRLGYCYCGARLGVTE